MTDLLSISTLKKMNLDDKKKYLNKRLRWLIEYCYQNSQTTKNRFDKAGMKPSAVNSIEDLKDLPILRKDDLIELHKSMPPFGNLSTIPVEKIGRIYISPGPIYDPYHFSKFFWQRHMALMKDIGFHKNDIVVITWSYHLVPAGLLLDESLRRIGANTIPFGTGNTELLIQVMKHLKVNGFFGAATFFINVIEKAKEMGYDIRRDFSIRQACIGGEMGGVSIRKKVEEEYNISTSDIYGTADIGMVAYGCKYDTGLHIAENVIPEIVNPDTLRPVSMGEIGELVITPIDESYPLIRFGTGDLAGWVEKPCPCGSKSFQITRILGRTGEAVRTRGMLIHPKQLAQALSKFNEIAKYQAVVRRSHYRDTFLLRIELKENIKNCPPEFSEILRSTVSEAVRIKVDHIEFLEAGTIPEEHKLIVDEREY